MPSAWAIGMAAAIAASTALLALDLPQGPQPDAEHPAQLVLVALLFAFWAYGGVLAAHGSRGALSGLAILAIVWVALPGGVVATDCVAGAECAPLTWIVAIAGLVVGIIAGYAAMMEAMQRRGKPQWGTAIFVTLPLLALGVVLGVRALSG